MSFEGYFRYLCAMGHTWCVDVYTDQDSCPVCDGPHVWSRLVDQTNDEGDDPPLQPRTPPIFKTCNLGHDHLIEAPTFVIPEDDPR